MATTFVPNPVGIAAFIRGPEIRADILRRTLRVEAVAKQLANSFTGRMRASIASELIPSPIGAVGRVSVGTSYALFVHQGTRPHVIRPRRAGGVLVFKVPPRAGTTVYARSVQHPGYKGNPFLREALLAAK